MEKKRKRELFGEFVDFLSKNRERRDSGSNSSASVDWPVEYLETDESDNECQMRCDVGETVKKEEVIIVEDEIEDEILKLLGEDEDKHLKSSPKIHDELAKRWTNIIQTSMDKEEKSKIIKKYPPIENMPQLTTPKLNPEIEAAMSETGKKRDKSISAKQQEIAAAISALGGLLSSLVAKKEKIEKSEIIERVSDASRILCEIYGADNKLRRYCALEGFNKDMKHSLQQREPGEFLFGNNLCEGIKTVKAVAKAAKELKNKPALNSQGPLRTKGNQYSSRENYPRSLTSQGFQGTGQGPATKRYVPAPNVLKKGNYQGSTLRVRDQSRGAKPRR